MSTNEDQGALPVSWAWACAGCGSRKGFHEVWYPAGDVDVACDECGSKDTSEIDDVLDQVISDRDAARARVAELEADAAAKQARIAALEAALVKTAQWDHSEDCEGRHDEDGEWVDDPAAEDCTCGLGWAKDALSGGTSALDVHDAALREEIAREVESHAEDVDSMHWRQAHRIIAQRIVAGADVLATIRAKGGK